MKDEPRNDDPRLLRALAVKGRNAAFLRGHRNVTGVGVGFREVGGRRTDEVVVRVYVSRKVPADELAPEDLLPRSLDGVTVDVAEVKLRAVAGPADHQLRHSVAKGGISIGNGLLGGSGTLGAAVFDERSGQQLILSNWHVLCGRLDCVAGEAILQPGTGGGDAGQPSDLFARLLRWRFDEYVDAAVAVVTGHRFCTEELFELGRVSTRVGAPVLGLEVWKSGRTTGVTPGRITDVDVDGEVEYGGSIGLHEVRDQLFIKDDDGAPVSLPGDSGSLWVDAEMRAVALNFAGSSDGARATANPIGPVLEALAFNFGPGAALQDYAALAAQL